MEIAMTDYYCPKCFLHYSVQENVSSKHNCPYCSERKERENWKIINGQYSVINQKNRKISALKGVITKLKKKISKNVDPDECLYKKISGMRYISAIKEYRTAKKTDLKTSKEAIEHLEALGKITIDRSV